VTELADAMGCLTTPAYYISRRVRSPLALPWTPRDSGWNSPGKVEAANGSRPSSLSPDLRHTYQQLTVLIVPAAPWFGLGDD
jgi:hypothetical protein